MIAIEQAVILVLVGILFSWMLWGLLHRSGKPTLPSSGAVAGMTVGMSIDGRPLQTVPVSFIACVIDHEDDGHEIRVMGRDNCIPHVAAYLCCIAVKNSGDGIEATLQKIQDEAMEMARERE